MRKKKTNREVSKMKKNVIDYIYASNGGIVFCSGSVLNQVGFAKSAKVAAYVLETKGWGKGRSLINIVVGQSREGGKRKFLSGPSWNLSR